ncbi:hypothetical protein [Streptomyces sp. NPDC053367]|uniref:hypothetical protein n=1 Tax=Streptomyces sp. NPDC053367 TaxID=3365700 RepID=UPI0037D23A5F
MASAENSEAPRELEFLFAEEATSPTKLCSDLGLALGLGQPVPVAVMRRALVDKTFLFHLANCRGHPDLLRVLFSDSANRRYEDDRDPDQEAVNGDSSPVQQDPSAARYTPSSPALAWKAGKAIARWGSTGFARVSPGVFEARFGACQRCEHLVDPPDRAVYKVRLRRQSDPRICSACGCVASRKASLPTEHCPVADEENPGLNRWGEAMQFDDGGVPRDNHPPGHGG